MTQAFADHLRTLPSASGMRTFSLGPKIQATLRQLQEDQAIWEDRPGVRGTMRIMSLRRIKASSCPNGILTALLSKPWNKPDYPVTSGFMTCDTAWRRNGYREGRVRRWSANAWVIPTLALPCKFMGMCCPMTKYRPPMKWRISWSVGRKNHQHFINTKCEKRAYRRIRESQEPSQKWRNDNDILNFGVR